MSSTRQKILFVNTYDDPKDGAGAERTLHTLIDAMGHVNYDTVLASTASTAGLHLLHRNGLKVWRAGLKNVYWPTRETRRSWPLRRLWHAMDLYNQAMRKQFDIILERERPDVISLHNLPGWSVAAIDAATTRHIPIVQVLHDFYYICPAATMFKRNMNCATQCANCRLMRLPHRRMSNKINAVVAVSNFVLNRHLEQGYFARTPSRNTIYNARAAKALRLAEAAAHRRDIEADAGRARVSFGFIGTLFQGKGIEFLLETFLQLNVANATLIIAGSGEFHYVQSLRSRFQDSRIRFIGQVRQAEFFPLVDVTIVPSLWHEPLGNVVFESFAFGIPVIGARRGGIPEMIKDGENGFLFEPDEVGSLLAIMKRIADRPAIAESMRSSAERSGLFFLDTQHWASLYKSVYTEAVHGLGSR